MPPLVSWMVLNLSWERSFYVAAVAAVLAAAAWGWYVRDHPSQHWAVNGAELNLIRQDVSITASARLDFAVLKLQLRNGNLLRLVLSYTLNGYVSYVFVFWFYLYLVQVRHFGQAAAQGLARIVGRGHPARDDCAAQESEQQRTEIREGDCEHGGLR